MTSDEKTPVERPAPKTYRAELHGPMAGNVTRLVASNPTSLVEAQKMALAHSQAALAKKVPHEVRLFENDVLLEVYRAGKRS